MTQKFSLLEIILAKQQALISCILSWKSPNDTITDHKQTNNRHDKLCIDKTNNNHNEH